VSSFTARYLTRYGSFQRRVFPDDHLHWYWQGWVTADQCSRQLSLAILLYIVKQG